MTIKHSDAALRFRPLLPYPALRLGRPIASPRSTRARQIEDTDLLIGRTRYNPHVARMW